MAHCPCCGATLPAVSGRCPLFATNLALVSTRGVIGLVCVTILLAAGVVSLAYCSWRQKSAASSSRPEIEVCLVDSAPRAEIAPTVAAGTPVVANVKDDDRLLEAPKPKGKDKGKEKGKGESKGKSKPVIVTPPGWYTDFPTARTVAAAKNQPLFVVFRCGG